ncbi:MAG TPA: hypothetical protein VHD81_05040 [Mycobacteriales bacterium]|nr:hypothetical protein [Mycobacteriales bacterium]
MIQFTATLPAPFRAVPPLGGSDFDTWRTAVCEQREPAVGVEPPTIERDLDGLVAAMKSESELRRWFVMIPPAPYRHCVSALGWVEAEPAGDTTSETVRACANEIDQADIESAVTSSASIHELAGRTAVIAHQFRPVSPLGPNLLESQLIERCAGVMLDPASQVLVRVDLTAVDLRAFDDAVTSALDILNSVQIEAALS